MGEKRIYHFYFLSPFIGSDSAEDDDDEEDEENGLNSSSVIGTGGPHPCVVCKAVLEHHGQSRPLPKHQAPQYGLLVNTVFLSRKMERMTNINRRFTGSGRQR